jgi:hypothetical protein
VLTAEALCLSDAPPRRRLFPRTELADSLPASFDQLKVASTDDFPKEPGFDVRIDNEVVTVTKISGNQWTVKRAAEGSTKAYHAPKSEVELDPVRDDQRNTTLDERRKSLASHPFVLPAPPPDSSDPAKQTRLMATMVTGEEHSAWLYNEMTKSKTVVQKNSSIAIGDIQGTVVAIEATAIQIKRGNDLWEVSIGKDLRSMTRVGGGADQRAGDGGSGGGDGGGDDSLFPSTPVETAGRRGSARRFGNRGKGGEGRDRSRSRRSGRADVGPEAER